MSDHPAPDLVESILADHRHPSDECSVAILGRALTAQAERLARVRAALDQRNKDANVAITKLAAAEWERDAALAAAGRLEQWTKNLSLRLRGIPCRMECSDHLEPLEHFSNCPVGLLAIDVQAALAADAGAGD